MGMRVVHIFWDIEKFFDSVDPGIMATNSKELEYPSDDFAMAMQVHLAPRVLQLRKAVSDVLTVNTGMLAGSLHSVPMAKSYLDPAITAVDEYKEENGEAAENVEM